jgi:hypothetical protein
MGAVHAPQDQNLKLNVLPDRIELSTSRLPLDGKN